jgi:hypothetical protein
LGGATLSAEAIDEIMQRSITELTSRIMIGPLGASELLIVRGTPARCQSNPQLKFEPVGLARLLVGNPVATFQGSVLTESPSGKAARPGICLSSAEWLRDPRG